MHRGQISWFIIYWPSCILLCHSDLVHCFKLSVCCSNKLKSPWKKIQLFQINFTIQIIYWLFSLTQFVSVSWTKIKWDVCCFQTLDIRCGTWHHEQLHTCSVSQLHHICPQQLNLISVYCFQLKLLWARNRIYSPSSWSNFSVRIRFKHLSLISSQILITDHSSVLLSPSQIRTLSDKHHPNRKSFLLGQEEAIESLCRPPITSSSASIIPSAALGLIWLTHRLRYQQCTSQEEVTDIMQ